MRTPGTRRAALEPELVLPLTLLARYVFFLSRRPISAANRHFLVERAAALRPLATLVPSDVGGPLEGLARGLRALCGANVAQFAETLTRQLVPLLPRAPADDVLLTPQPPPPALLGRATRVRLLLGPGIGLGDEVLCGSLPAWLKTAASAARLEVLSTRPELWADAPGVDAVVRYVDALDLLRALRARDADLVMLADFEKPALSPALTREPGSPSYVELALGARCVTAFDARTRSLHERPLPAGQADDYYRFAEQALLFLGARASLRARTPPPPRPRGARLELAVSPFTSKHEPAAAAWSALLGALLPAHAVPCVRLRFDPGPNAATERLAVELLRAVRARAGADLACELAGSGRTLDRPGLLALLRASDAVLCADSFAAHAAARSGCTTLVIAGEELQAWRVPHAPAFYFDERARPEALAGGLRRVLGALDPRLAEPVVARPWDTPAAARARATLAALLRALDDESAALVALLDAYEDCGHALRALSAESDAWPTDFEALLADRDYARLLPPLPALRDAPARAEALRDARGHVARLLHAWENSNLCKYLALVARAETA